MKKVIAIVAIFVLAIVGLFGFNQISQSKSANGKDSVVMSVAQELGKTLSAFDPSK